MNIVVCVKESVDLEQVRINEATREPMLAGLPLEIEDLSKNAVEEALKLKDQYGGRVLAIALGPPSLKKTVKEVLAMGVDEAWLLTHPSFQSCDESAVAHSLAQAIKKAGDFDLVLCGEGSADNYSGIIGPTLSELLGIPAVTTVRELAVEDGTVRATRDLEDGYEIVQAPLPAVITVTGEINTPHLPSLTEILKAMQKPIKELGPQDLDMAENEIGEGARRVRRLKSVAPKVSRKNVIFEGTLDEGIKNLLESLLREGAIAK